MTILLQSKRPGVPGPVAPADRASAAPLRMGADAAASVESFQGFRCRADDVKRLFARRPECRRIAAELLPLVQRMSEHPAGAFPDIAHLKAQASDDGGAAPSPGAIRAMRDLFLELPNRHLQRLYRAHLRAFPPAPATPHEEKIAALANVQDAARSILAGFDWLWLADWLWLDRIGGSARDCLWRLSNFAFDVKRVNFRFTYHCNIECKHCYNGSGPHAKAQRIELDAMLGIIAQMPDADISALNLTGGEPFLYPDELVALIEAGRTARLKTISIFTNGFWATTQDKARSMLGRLAAAGFMQGPGDFLKVSTGVYHQEFIEFDRVATLARCYHDTFGRRLRVDFELAPGKLELADRVRENVAAADLGGCVSLSIRESIPLGRGRNLQGTILRQIDAPCRSVDEIVFDPDGSARPCCGLNNENQGIKIGQLGTHRLRDLVKRMQNDPILQFLASKPMSAIFDHVAVEKNAAGYAGICSLCQHALGGLADKEMLQAQLFDQQEFYPFWFEMPAADARH
jgi:4Fe-4S single cluster domain/Radical SAM superfamily